MLSKPKIEIGIEVEALCTPCKNPTVHVISAIKDGKISKVMCKACLSSHRYRPVEDEATPKTKSTSKTKSAAKTKSATKAKTASKTASKTNGSIDDIMKSQDKVRRAAKTRMMKKWNNLLEVADSENPSDYAVNGSYDLQEVIQHALFGLGVVVKVVDENKMDVVFEDGVKTLVMKI